MLTDSRDVVILKNEAKALNPKNSTEDKTKSFIMHNLLRFVEELRRVYTQQKQQHGYLQ